MKHTRKKIAKPLRIIVLILIFAGIAGLGITLVTLFKNQPIPEETTPLAFLLNTSGDYQRDVPEWTDRPYKIHLPTQYNGTKVLPVVILIHGGGGNANAMRRLTCPNGNLLDDKCLNKLADREGFITIYPNGTSTAILPTARTFNAGGGQNGYACVSKYACLNNVDDVSYFRALLNDLAVAANTDNSRIYAVGISNGAAMSHRLACQLSDRIAAIASVAGGNQYSAVAPCTPTNPLAVLEIHGTADPDWPYSGGSLIDLTKFVSGGGNAFSVSDTISGWVSRDKCNQTPIIKQLPNIANDGTLATKFTYSGCSNGTNVLLYKIDNGGHTWPQGYQYLNESTIGKTSQQFNANEVIWNFLKQYSK